MARRIFILSSLEKPRDSPYINIMRLKELDNYLAELLRLEDFDKADVSLNGLQVGDAGKEVRKIAFAVDACGESFRRAKESGADLLFVHHGLFWGGPRRITGDFYERIRQLMDGDLALYAAHLPLDSHPELGNNAAMARQLELIHLEPFGLYHGLKIGFKGSLKEEKSLEEILALLGVNREECLSVLPFGKERIRSIGLISGGASSDVDQALEEELDLFITGEAAHEIYHTCQEGRINFVAAGHYFTETFGVKAMAGYLRTKLGLETVFLDIPTGL